MAIWNALDRTERHDSAPTAPHALQELGERLAASPRTAWEWIERLQSARGAPAPRALGRVPTPADVAERMARALLGGYARRSELRLLDAGCGSGRLLAAVAREAARRKLRVACEGVEIDPAAARWAQALEPLARAGAAHAITRWTVRRADFLLEPTEAATYDLAIANPPYVPWRDLEPGYRTRLQAHHRGPGTDLAALFVDALLDVLRPGGRLCVIVPNKLLAAHYAAALRARLLAEMSLEQIWDLSGARVFPGHASYPVVIVARRSPPGARHQVQVHGTKTQRRWTQRAVSKLPDSVLPLGLAPELFEITSRLLAGRVLGDVLRVRCGIAVSGFGRAIGSGSDRILQSGDVRAFRLRPARRFAPQRAGVPAATLERLRAPKILVPGMFRRLCAAYDGEGRLVGRVYFLPVEGRSAAERAARRALLLALLNSRLYALLYAGLFAAVAQSGGWLRLNAPYLESLPWPQTDDGAEIVKRVAACERRRPTAAEIESLDSWVECRFGLDPPSARVLRRLARGLPPAW